MTCREESRSQSLIFRSEDQEKIAAVVLGWSIYHKKSSTGLFAGAGLLGGGRESDCRHTDYRMGGWSDGRTADGRDGSVVQSV